MNIQDDDLPDVSDSSDEDYDPGIKEEEVSEIEYDGDEEEPLSDSDESKPKINRRRKGESLSDSEESKPKIKRRRKGETKPKKRPQKEINDEADSKENEVEVEVKEEEKKKKEEDLWADFMKDTGFVSKNSPKTTSNSSTHKSTNNVTSNKQDTKPSTLQKRPEKVKIKQIFEFAGEEVEVEKEVAINSAEARLLSNVSSDTNKTGNAKRSAGLSGIGNVLSQLSKKPKISTLEKTKLDWDRFKKEEKLEEELSTHNKGKDGYLERQEFLERADLRTFEIEKELRTVERNKRFTSTL